MLGWGVMECKQTQATNSLGVPPARDAQRLTVSGAQSVSTASSLPSTRQYPDVHHVSDSWQLVSTFWCRKLRLSAHPCAPG